MRRFTKSAAAESRKVPRRPSAGEDATARAPAVLKIAVISGEDERRGPGLHILGTLYEFPDGSIARVPRTLLRKNGKLIDDIDVAHYVTIDKKDIQQSSSKPWIEKRRVSSDFTALERDKKQILEHYVDHSPNVVLDYDGPINYLMPSPE